MLELFSFATLNLEFMVSRLTVLAFISCLFMFSCGDDDDGVNIDNTDLAFTDGFFIVNEGPFGEGSGSLSFYDRVEDEVFNNIFQDNNSDEAGNPILLGNIVQSMSILNETAYVAVNNANRVVTIDLEDFSFSGEINGLVLPRFILPISNQKAYISTWGEGGIEGSVAVLNTTDNTITTTIDVGSGAEKMYFREDDNKLFVANNGGFSRDSVVSVLDTNTDELVSNIVIGDNPESIVEDKNGTIWVLASGYFDFNTMESTPGRLVALENGNTIGTAFEVPFGSSDLVIDASGENLYYTTFSGIYKQNVDSESLSDEPFIMASLYGLSIDPVTGNLLGADAGDFASNGMVHTWDETGALLRSISVGVIPNGFSFE